MPQLAEIDADQVESSRAEDINTNVNSYCSQQRERHISTQCTKKQ